MADAGEVRRRNPGAVVRGAHGQVLPIERLDDLGGQDRLELLRVRVFAPEVTKHVPAPRRYFPLLASHRSISFRLFRGSLIRSISRLGVLMPCVDFFWKARTTQTSSPSCTASLTCTADFA